MGTMGLTSSLTRSVAVSATYYYLRYRFERGAALPIGILAEGERQGIRGTVTVWVALSLTERGDP
jgi:hypothetical protein